MPLPLFQPLLRAFILGILTATWVIPPQARASDGVLEINQTCAVQTGCFPGDTAGFPVTLAAAGASHRLTSRLVVPNETTHGLLVTAPNVSIDLAGFDIVRSGCETATSDCAPTSGTGSGIARSPNTVRGVRVHDGSIVGMGDSGVDLGDASSIRALHVRWNRRSGIHVGSSSIVRESIAYANGGAGIFGSSSMLVTQSSSFANQLHGISMIGGTVAHNTVGENAGRGIIATSSATISGNHLDHNGDGISGGSGSAISGNVVDRSIDIGIFAGSFSAVSNNVVRSSGGFGLSLHSGATYRENTLSNNTAGSVTGTGRVNMGSNSCDGATTCP